MYKVIHEALFVTAKDFPVQDVPHSNQTGDGEDISL